MSDAVYGLLGALGGAAVAGAAAFWGPLQLQKRARRESEAERELARSEAAEARRLELLRAQVARVVLVRRTIAVWDDLLDETFRTLSSDHLVAPDEFRQAADHARAEASAAMYEALNDGLYIPATGASLNDPAELQRHLGLDREPDAETRARESGWVLDVFDMATASLSRAIQAARDAEIYPLATFVTQHVYSAHECRAELSQALMDYVERITDVTTIEIRGSRDSEAGRVSQDSA